MYALTLWPEWLPTIVHMGKRVENRGWPPPARVLGHRIALHAGASIGGGRRTHGIQWLQEAAAGAGWQLELRTTPNLGLFARRHDSRQGHTFPIHLGAVVATAVVQSAVHADDNLMDGTDWAMSGCWHWRLADVQALAAPISCRGRQGLWRLPPKVLAEVMR